MSGIFFSGCGKVTAGGRRAGLWFTALKYLAWVGQLGLSLVLPPVLACWAAGWLRIWFGLGSWIFAAALVLGLLTSIRCLFRFLRMVQREAEDTHEGSGNRTR